MAKSNTKEVALRKALEALPEGEDTLAQQIQHRIEQMHADTSDKIWKLVEESCRAETLLIKRGEKEKVQKLQEFTESIAIAQELLLAFRRNPKISGHNGVSASLKLTRHGVYVRLSGIGLEHKDINTQTATIASLVHKSPILTERMKASMRIMEELRGEKHTKKKS